MLLQIALPVGFVYLLSFLFFRSKRKNLPPGPEPWSVLGNIPDFIRSASNGKSAVQLLTEWKAKYGDVYTIWLGPIPAVNVCDYKTAIDAFVRAADAHTGRWRPFLMNFIRDDKGLVLADGEQWQEQRRFALYVLRNFGLGRNLMQESILQQIDYNFGRLDRRIKAETDKKVVIDPGELIDPLVGSIINKMLAGFSFDETNIEKFLKLKHDLDRSLNASTLIDAALIKSWNVHLPGFKQRFKTLMEPISNVKNYMKKLVQTRKTTIADGSYQLDENDPNDYIDAYLIEMEKRKRNGDFVGGFSEEDLVCNMVDLWVAGMETTILTLMWGEIYLLNSPEVQEKVRKEVLECTGGNRHVEFADKKNLPYLSATITEIQRLASILNFNLWHRTTTCALVGDYVIPEDTTITYQMSVIMSDENQFKDPFKFNPDRFLGAESDQHVIPFGIGKRSCLGEGLARAELFLILGNLLQHYKLSVPDGEEPPSTQPQAPFGVMHRTKPFQAVFEKVSC